MLTQAQQAQVTTQQVCTLAVHAMFWGVVLAAVAVPVAAAIGGVVAGKILPKNEKR